MKINLRRAERKHKPVDQTAKPEGDLGPRCASCGGVMVIRAGIDCPIASCGSCGAQKRLPCRYPANSLRGRGNS